MKKSISWALGFVLLLAHFSFSVKLPSHARRSSVLAAVGGTCTRYSCATYDGFKQCLGGDPSRYTPLEVHTKKEDNAVFGIYRDHPNCYRSFCIANCMLPPGIEENMNPQRGEYLFTIDEGSEVDKKLSRLKKDTKRESYMREMNQFVKDKKTNCIKKGLGPVMRRLCSFCGSASLSSEGYKMIQACEARAEDFSENPQQRLGRLVNRNQEQPATSGGFSRMIAQAGTQMAGAVLDHAKAQGHSALSYGKVYVADQGRGIHNLAQTHIKAGANQVRNARDGAFQGVQGFGKRASGLASGLTGDIEREKKKLAMDFEKFERAAQERRREIQRLPREKQVRARKSLEQKMKAYHEKYEEDLRELEERESDGEDRESELGDHEVDFEGMDEEDE